MSKGYKECWYELGDIKGQALTLERITLKRAQTLAKQLSNILPWSDLALGEESLLSHFKREDPALSRFSIWSSGDGSAHYFLHFCVRGFTKSFLSHFFRQTVPSLTAEQN